MAPRSISAIAREAYPEIAWKPPWRQDGWPRIAANAAPAIPGRRRTRAADLAPARSGSARAPPSLPSQLAAPSSIPERRYWERS